MKIRSDSLNSAVTQRGRSEEVFPPRKLGHKSNRLKEAYAVVNLRSETGDFYVKPLGSAGAADPLNQRGSVGWQHPFTARILNDAFMLNLMATAS
ncbi:MAG TPA: hypothetical protein PL000_07275 [Anaerolineales bacterium]|nr:hypothetical protein [Anaerolineales bacterium]